jgi:hypothetical protein
MSWSGGSAEGRRPLTWSGGSAEGRRPLNWRSVRPLVRHTDRFYLDVFCLA